MSQSFEKSQVRTAWHGNVLDKIGCSPVDVMSGIRKLMPRRVKASLSKILSRHSLIVSQAGQDLWAYGEAFNEKKFGYFLDIGAHDGISMSNTYLMESKYFWRGICIEADPTTFEKLKKNRSTVCVNVCLDKEEGEVSFVSNSYRGGIVDQDVDNKEAGTKWTITLRTKPLISVLKEHCAPKTIDYMSIDVEGAEERILSRFDFNEYRFLCITIERPTDLLRDLLKSHGYILLKDIPGLDCFYIHQTFLADYQKNCRDFYQNKYLAIRWK